MTGSDKTITLDQGEVVLLLPQDDNTRKVSVDVEQGEVRFGETRSRTSTGKKFSKGGDFSVEVPPDDGLYVRNIYPSKSKVEFTEEN